MTRWIGTAFLALALLLLPAKAIAGMAVSPLQQRVVVKPGKVAFFSVTVTNVDRGFQTLPCKVNVALLDFTVSPQGGISFHKDLKHNRSAAEWISFDANELTLEPGESKKIRAKVSAPFSADGDYWAAIMISLGGAPQRKSGIQIKLRTGSGVFVHVERRNYTERGSVIDANIVLPEFDPVRNATSSPERWKETPSNGVDPNENLVGEPDEGKGFEEAQEKQALRISAELKNDGLVAFIANGKAFLYSENWRRIAFVPLYTERRRILPGHTRCFTGVMSQPLPAGQYKLRLFFDPGSKYGRKITKEMEFSVSDRLARQWAENFTDDDIQMLEIEPQEFKQTLTPGRFTAARFLVANRGLSTVAIRCRLEADELPEDWLKLNPTEFILNPNMRRNVVCSARIPQDAQPGEYNAVIHIEAERSGLSVRDQDNIEPHRIPICIVIK